MPLHTVKLLLASAWLVAGGTVLAHSELEKPLFVSATGSDQARCHDPAAPCRSIEYALQRVGKGGQLRIAAGRYDVSQAEDLFHLISGVVDVHGGYDEASGFEQQGHGLTILTGVPVEYRALLGQRGLHIVADRKGARPAMLEQTGKMLALRSKLQSSLQAAACSGGTVNGLACSNIDLQAHLAFEDISARPAAAADIWGFMDLNTHREYVIVGYDIGTAVVDVSDPGRPREIGFIDGQRATWRDIKIYQVYDPASSRYRAYAYVTTDGAGDGMFVIDLSGLPQTIERINYSSDFLAAHNVYAANTEFATGLSQTGATPTLIIAGSSLGGGRFRSYSLANPRNPAFLTMPNVSSNDYMHDAASMIITDARKDTQCVNAGDYCEVLFDFNETTVDLWDITAANNPVRLSRTPYNNASYVHSGWVSEDRQVLFVQDELDEQRLGLQTTLRAFSIANLTQPAAIGDWEGPTTAIDHNGFVRGNRYYMSNYSRGLTILDISNPAAVSTVGRLDTYPFSDSASFAGAWGVYPYLPSGTIAVSDIDSGLYLATDNTLAVSAGSLTFSQASFAASEGQNATVVVERTGGSSGAVSVRWETIAATADNDDLANAGSGTLSWPAGDNSSRTIELSFASDGDAEGLQQLFLKLYAPEGGATLSSPAMSSVYVSDPGDSPSLQFANSNIVASERGFGTAVAVLQRSGNAAGAVSVQYDVSENSATAGSDFTAALSGTVHWADGDATPKWIEFELSDDGVAEPDETFDITLSNASGSDIGSRHSLQVTITDGSGSNSAPNSVAGSSQTVSSGTAVTLNGSQSNDPDGDTLQFSWSQTAGPSVSLSDAGSANARFTAPSVNSDTLLRFALTVTDPAGLQDTATASVTVTASGNSGSGSTNSGGGGAVYWLLLCLLVVLLKRVAANNRLLAIRAR